MNALEWLRIIFIGIVEGITEWLPISSTGHMILLDELWPTSAPSVITESFWEMFLVVIQLGAILAVVTYFFHRLNPFSQTKSPKEKRDTFDLWGKVVVSCIPAGIAALLFDDWMDSHLNNGYVVSMMLIIYGIAFIVIEKYNHQKASFQINSIPQISYKMALSIGLVQLLALVPGTSRSGVTILGAMLFGCSRYIAAEFTFFLAIPVMAGASFFKLLKYFLGDNSFSGTQIFVVILGMAVAYLVSIVVIRFLMQFIKKKDFKPFGYYRIIWGSITLLYFTLTNLLSN